MRRYVAVLILAIIFLSSCGAPEEARVVEEHKEVEWVVEEPAEEFEEEIVIDTLEEAEHINIVVGGFVDTLGELAGPVPDEYMITQEEVYVDSAVIEEVYVEPVVTEEVVEEPDYVDYGTYAPHDLRYMGVIYWGGYRWTWYSEKVLPGPGLNIPGRWSDGNFVRDEEGNICLASNDLAWGSYVYTPWGWGKVYDSGCSSGTLDVYVSW